MSDPGNTSPSKERWKNSTFSRSDYARRRRETLVHEIAKAAWNAALAAAKAEGKEEPRELLPGYGRCAYCGRDLSCDMLEIDHIKGRQWDISRMSAWMRVARYWREWEAGVEMRVLCRSCNARLGGGLRYGRRRR